MWRGLDISNGTFYILVTYVIAYGVTVQKISESTMLIGVLLSAVIQLVAIPGFAALSDKIGCRGLYMAGAVLLGLWGFPLFWLINSRVVVLIWIALIVGQTFRMMYGPQAAFYAELFSARLRYSGASLGYQIGALFGGGLATIIAAALLAATKNSQSISVYIAVMGLISFVSVFLLS